MFGERNVRETFIVVNKKRKNALIFCLDITLVYFPVAMTKGPEKSELGMRRLILAHGSRVQSYMGDP